MSRALERHYTDMTVRIFAKIQAQAEVETCANPLAVSVRTVAVGADQGLGA